MDMAATNCCAGLPTPSGSNRIDHLLLSRPLAQRLNDAGVDHDVRGWEKASDHAPTWIEITDPAKKTAVRQTTTRTGQTARRASKAA